MSKRSEQLDRNWEAAKIDLVTAAEKAGIDPGIMAKMAGLESGFDATARPVSKDANRNTVTQYDGTKAMSSAHGYGQLTNDTWATMIHRYGEKYGVQNAATLTKAQANGAVYREDVSLQAGMFAELTRENFAAAASRGGADVSTNIYTYHNLGQRTGATFLAAVQSDPGARVDTILSQDIIKGNNGLYGDGTISVATAYQKMTDTLSVYEKYATEVQRPPTLDPLTASAATSAHPGYSEVLRQGNHGAEVGVLQNDLNALGYTDAKHAPLRPDNHFGASTTAAVEAFQRDNHLPADGVVGSMTSKAIEEQVTTRMRDVVNQSLSRLDSPEHPDHALFQQTRSLVHHLDHELGRAPDQMSDNIASALVVSARSEGLHRIDKIALSDDGSRLWAVQRWPEGMRHGFLDAHASVPTSSVNISMEQSAALWPRAMQQFQQHQEHTIAKQQESRVQQQGAQQTAPEVGGLSR